MTMARGRGKIAFFRCGVDYRIQLWESISSHLNDSNSVLDSKYSLVAQNPFYPPVV
jgi:hypothetical protein